jgi:phytoene dehydrogenase-like protein
MTGTETADAVVVGSGYGGLITAALLGRAGFRVLVVDRNPEPGGRCRSVRSGEVYTPYGYASSRETSDMFMLMSRRHRFGLQAAERARATVALVGPIRPVMRVHVLATGDVCSLGGGFSEYATRVLGVAPEQVDPLRDCWKALLSLDADAALDQPLSAWLKALPSPELRAAFERVAHIFDTLPAEQISTGRFAKGMQTPIELYYADDPEVPGMSGFTEAYARVVRDCGGVLALGHDVAELVLDDDQIAGVVLQNQVSRVTTVRTSRVVFAGLPYQLESLVSPDRLGDRFVDDARALCRFQSDIALEVSLLSRLPRRRSDGAVEDYAGWCRILRGAGRDYGGGWWFPSMSSPGLAPPGKAVIEIGQSSGYHELRTYRDTGEARANLDRIRSYLGEFYADLDEVTESRQLFVHRPPNLDSWKFAIAPRLPLVVPGVNGLYHVSAAADVEGAVQDIDANAAMQVADLILGET